MISKRFFTYCTILYLLCLLFSCDAIESDDKITAGRPTIVDLQLCAGTTANTRWSDTSALDAEMMNNWVVVVTDESDNVEAIVQSSYAGVLKEKDVVKGLELTSGSKCFYSFANLDITTLTTSAQMPQVGQKLDLKNTYTTPENGVIPTSGIPMSNMQKITLRNVAQQTVELTVIRLLAKLSFNITNQNTYDIQLTDIGLDGITDKNSEVVLLPTSAMVGGNYTTNYIYTINGGQIISAGASSTVTFYINESSQPVSSLTGYKINLKMTREGKPAEQRYALLNWTEFKRNSYRIVPITIDDYQLELEVRDYPPIGVYPAAITQDAEGGFTCTFKSGGDFMILPKVKQHSTNMIVAYSFVSWELQSNPILPNDFFDKNPTYNSRTGEIEGTIGNVSGTAYYIIKINVDKGVGVSRQLTYKLYISR